MGLLADNLDLTKQPRRPSLDAADLLRYEVFPQGAELARFPTHMQGDLLHTRIEDPHEALVPTCPDRAAQVLRRRGVIRLGNFDVTVAADDPLGLVKEGEPLRASRNQPP